MFDLPPNVNDMSNMFQFASSFNQDLTSWSPSNVQSMESMFEGATSFNNGGNTGGGGVCAVCSGVGNVKTMEAMFKGATSFNIDISSWSVNKVITMSSMFEGASDFDSPPPSATALVINMANMFKDCINFNKSVNNMVVGNVLDMSKMFQGAIAYNNAGVDFADSFINSGNVQTMEGMFQDAHMNQFGIVRRPGTAPYMVSVDRDLSEYEGDWNEGYYKPNGVPGWTYGDRRVDRKYPSVLTTMSPAPYPVTEPTFTALGQSAARADVPVMGSSIKRAQLISDGRDAPRW